MWWHARVIGLGLVLLPGCLLLMHIEGPVEGREPFPEASRACALASDDPRGPVIFFTDLESGPTTGGADDLGVFLSIYGLRLGPAARVVIGGVEVARYVSRSDAETSPEPRTLARGLERIVVQPGDAVRGGELVVVAGGRASNPLAFAVRSGNIYLVDPTAPPGGDGSFARPFQSLYAAPTVAQPGDVVYLRGGLYESLDPSTEVANHGAALLLTRGGEDGAPLAFVGYPDLPPVLGGGMQFSILPVDAQGGAAPGNLVFANLVLTDTTSVALPITGSDYRVVGNAFVAAHGAAAVQVNGVTPLRANARLLGNVFADLDGGPALKIIGAVTGVELGWSELRNILHTGVRIDPTAGDDYTLHDNLIVEQRGFGIELTGSARPAPFKGIRFYNNVIYVVPNAGEIVLAMRDLPVTLGVEVQNNTLVQSTAIVGASFDERSDLYLVRNNIFYPGGNEYFAHDVDTHSAMVRFERNLYFGSPAAEIPADEHPILGNPLLAAADDSQAPDVSLLEDSAAIDVGADTSSCADYFGVLRPQGSAYDVGSVEHVAP